jgi:predicted MFS family arabinose efflux permease
MPPGDSPDFGDVAVEESEEAMLGGDSRFTPGTARAALSHPIFRTLYLGFFLSSIGTWMQQAVLIYYGYELTGSALFNSVLLFAQLGPVLVLGPLAGVIADSIDRKRLLVVVSLLQLAAAALLAVVVIVDDPNLVLMVVAVLVGGVGSAAFMPAYSALLPSLVGPEDLPGAISLQSAGMNLSRVIGPPIGVFILGWVGPSWVFALNAASFLFVVAALGRVELPVVAIVKDTVTGFRRLASGFAIAASDPVIKKSLITITTFSSLCLLWIGQLPVFADEQLGIADRDSRYGILYACLGIGAALGSIAIGTVFASRSKPQLVRSGLLFYAVLLTVFALLRDPAPAFPVMVLLGVAYFGTVTALNTAMQARLAPHQRGRVMALWMMGFGGAVAVANLILAPLVDAVGMPPLMLAGAAIAVGLAWFADVRPPGELVRDVVTAPATATD